MLSFTEPLTMAHLIPTNGLLPPLTGRKRVTEELHDGPLRTPRHPAPCRAIPDWEGGTGDQTRTLIKGADLTPGAGTRGQG